MHGIARREPELAGRYDERAALEAELDAATRGPELRVVVLQGTAGFGKSRLCRWLVERARSGGASPVTVGCGESGPLLSLLGGLLDVPAGPDRAAGVVAALDPGAAGRIEPLLRAPRRPWGTVPLVRRLLIRAADQRPRVVVFDDADQSLDVVRLTRALRADSPQAPLLLVLAVDAEALARNLDLGDQVEALCDTPGVCRLAVGPLDDAAQQALIAELAPLPPASQAAVLAEAEGHPGYVVARTARMLGPDALAPGGRAPAPAPDAAPSERCAAVWAEGMAAWLDHLAPEDRRLLEQAAALGQAVDEELWEQTVDDPGATMPPDQVQIDLRAARRRAHLMERLIEAGLAHETDTGFAFTHPALVGELTRQARQGGRLAARHRAAANHLRRRPQPDNALLLGHHLAEAGAWDEAALVLLGGIEFHWKYRDRQPLLTELERAERCVAAAGWAPTDPRRCDLLHARALLLTTAGRPDEAVEVARQAWAFARQTGDRARIARTVWRLLGALVIVSRWDEARAVIPAFLEVEDQQEDPACAGLARCRMGRCLLARGDRTGAERWFAEAERALLRIPPSTFSLGSLLELYGFTDRPARILEVGAELERLAYEEGRTDHQLFAMSKQVEAHLALGSFGPGLALARACLTLNDTLGDQRFARYMRVELGVLELRDGQIPEAMHTLTEALAVLDRHAFTWLALTALLVRVEGALALGDLPAVDRDLTEVAELVPLRRHESDALAHRLDRLAGLLVGAGLAERAARVERLRQRV